MTEEQFSEYAMIFFVGGLICFMGFIIYDLAKRAKVGRFGMIMMYVCLFAGVIGFVFKAVLVELLGI